MHLIQQLKTIPLFAGYFLKVVDQHSLQAPYVFQLYSRMLRGIKNSNGIPEIEEFRELLLKDVSVVKGEDFGAGTRISKSSKDKTISMIARHGISSRKDCIFLSELVKIFQPEICIELGTSLGIATAYLAKSSHTKSVYSLEGNESLASKAIELLNQLNCTNTRVFQTHIDSGLPRILDQLGRVDFAVIDANHTEKALLNYFNLFREKINPNGILVIDDIRWSIEMYRGWQKLVKEECVSLSLEFLNKGLLIFKKGIRKQHYVLSY